MITQEPKSSSSSLLPYFLYLPTPIKIYIEAISLKAKKIRKIIIRDSKLSSSSSSSAQKEQPEEREGQDPEANEQEVERPLRPQLPLLPLPLPPLELLVPPPPLPLLLLPPPPPPAAFTLPFTLSFLPALEASNPGTPSAKTI